jgi:hypothetical protein
MTQAADSPFCKSQATVQKAWDNTSISVYKECPRKYQYFILQGYRPKGNTAPALTFGGLYHKGLEIFDKAVALNVPFEEALEDTVREMMELSVTRGTLYTDPQSGAVKYISDEENTDEAHALSMSVGCTAKRISRAFFSDDTTRTRETLIRALIWYADHYKADPFKTLVLPNGRPAMELSFRFELPLESPDGDPYIYCGHLDKVATQGGEKWIVERKTSKVTLSSSFFSRFSPNSQVSGYATAGKMVLDSPVSGVLIDAAQTAVGFTRFGRGMAHRNPEMLDEWLNNTLQWIRRAERDGREGFWPMNEESCHKWSGCQFREVCSKSPGSRDKWLESNFQVDPWNPLENRGEEEE